VLFSPSAAQGVEFDWSYMTKEELLADLGRATEAPGESSSSKLAILPMTEIESVKPQCCAQSRSESDSYARARSH
jgi:hypothetical protein